MTLEEKTEYKDYAGNNIVIFIEKTDYGYELSDNGLFYNALLGFAIHRFMDNLKEICAVYQISLLSGDLVKKVNKDEDLDKAIDDLAKAVSILCEMIKGAK